MIFLSVGTQLSFDRLVRCVDEFVELNPDIEVYGQIGRGGYVPRNFEFCDFLGSREYERIYADANLVIAHAGMGTILSCLADSKPMALMPRRHALGEHRNDHQVATMNNFSQYGACQFFETVSELERICSNPIMESSLGNSFANSEFIDNLRKVIG
ncbi:glycosyltransferase [Oceanobacter kriegii]|uniref:glycosyltransferase n=1 Tax=Oceanobacter kriegii TaxID=64972 RepID=UPI000685DBA2|nr:glycosyltransferase [Oceanobacter kriegii]